MQNRTCTIAVNSVTYAMKAQDILTRAGIASSIVRLRPDQTPTGCAYGLYINCRDSGRASSQLNAVGINYRLIR